MPGCEGRSTHQTHFQAGQRGTCEVQRRAVDPHEVAVPLLDGDGGAQAAAQRQAGLQEGLGREAQLHLDAGSDRG